MDHGTDAVLARERSGLTPSPTDSFVRHAGEGDESVAALPTGQCGPGRSEPGPPGRDAARQTELSDPGSEGDEFVMSAAGRGAGSHDTAGARDASGTQAGG